MTKRTRLFIAVPMSIITWPFIAAAFSMGGFITGLGIMCAIGHSFGLLNARKEAREDARQEIKESLMCAFVWTIGSFLMWYDYYETGEIEF